MEICGSDAAVFFAGGNAAPDMALGLVDIQYLFDLQIQRPVELGQALRDVLVYGCHKMERYF